MYSVVFIVQYTLYASIFLEEAITALKRVADILRKAIFTSWWGVGPLGPYMPGPAYMGLKAYSLNPARGSGFSDPTGYR